MDGAKRPELPATATRTPTNEHAMAPIWSHAVLVMDGTALVACIQRSNDALNRTSPVRTPNIYYSGVTDH